MATVIDERVVAMRFDNKQFEAGAAESMSTLDKLKEKLNFKGVADGVNEIDKAASRVSLSGLTDAVSTVEARFSTMSVVAISAINNIVDSAMNMGVKLVKSLSLDQVTAGFDKYTAKTAAVQTIMNATGLSVDQVTNKLAKLQWFSDETSYSFEAMTNATSLFAASGVDIDSAISAIEGIAISAAHAGVSVEKASNAMGYFTKAMGRGYMMLTDWRSIEALPMTTPAFKNSILEAAADIGTLTRAGDGLYKTLKGDEVNANNLAMTLDEKWLTNNVLLKALNQYSEFADAVYDIADAYDTCAEAMEHVDATGMELAADGFAAAQKAKTFQESIDATKDYVSSSWSKMFEIIFGDYEESVKLWSDFGQTMWEVFGSGYDSKIDLMRESLSSGWKRLVSSTIEDTSQLKNALIDTATSYGYNVQKMIKDTGSFELSLHEGWANGLVLKDTITKLVDEYFKMSDAERMLLDDNEKLTYSMAYKLYSAYKDRGAVVFDEFAQQLSQMSGRENIIEAIGQAFENVMDVVNAFKEAFRDIFPPATSEQIYNLTNGLKEFIKSLKLTEPAINTLRIVFKALLLPVKAVVTALSVAGTLMLQLVKIVFKLVNAFLELPSKGEAVANVFKKIFGDERYERMAAALSTIIERIGNAFVAIKNRIVQAFSKINLGEKFTKLFQLLYDIMAPIAGFILDKIISGFEALANIDFTKVGDFAKGILTFIIEKLQVIGGILAPVKNGIVSLFGAFRDKTPVEVIAAVSDKVTSLKNEFKSFKTQFTSGGILNTLKSKFSEVGDVVNNLGNAFGNLLERLSAGKILVFAFGTAVTGTIFSTIKAINSAAGVFNNFGGVLKAFQQRIAPNKYQQIAKSLLILAGALIVMSLIDAERLAQATASMIGLMVGLVAVTAAMAIIQKTLLKDKDSASNMTKIGKAMVELSASVLILSGALYVLSKIDLNGIAARLAILGSVMAGLIAVAIVMSKAQVQLSKSVIFFIGFSASVFLIVSALEKLANADLSGIENSLGHLTILIGMMALLGIAASKVRFSGAAGLFLIIIDMMLLVKALKSLAKLDPVQLTTGVMAFIPLMLALNGMMLATNLAGKNALKAGVAILAMSAAILVISKAVKEIGQLDAATVVKGTLAVSALLGMFTIITMFSKFAGANATKAGAGIIAMSAAILLLSVAIGYIGGLSLKDAIQGTACVDAILAMFVLLIRSSGNIEKAAPTIAAMAATIGLLTASLVLLTLIPAKELITSAGVLSATIVAIGYAMKQVSKIGWKEAISSAVYMAVVIGGMTSAFVLLHKIDSDKLLAIAISLSGIMIALAASTKILKAVNFESGLKAAIVMGIMLAEVTAALAILDHFAGDNVIATATALSETLLAVSAVTVILSLINPGSAISGAAGFSAVIGILAGLMIGIGALMSVDAIRNFATLGSEFMQSLARMTPLILELELVAGALALLSIAAVPAIAGAATFDAVIGVLTGLIIGLGGLMSIPGFEELVNKGGVLFAKLGEVIGEFIGSILGGVASGFSSKMPEVGKNLSQFSVLVMPFIYLMRNIEDKDISKIVDVSGALSSIAGIKITSTGENLPLLAQRLCDFSTPFEKYVDNISKIAFSDLDKATTVMHAASELASAIHGQSTFSSGALISFGNQLYGFAVGSDGNGGFKGFIMALSGVTVDESAVTNAVNAARIMNGFASEIQSTGGILQQITGIKDLPGFADDMYRFIVGDEGGKGFKDFNDAIATINVREDRIEMVRNAARMMNDLAKELQNTGGLLQNITGTKDLSEFASDMYYFMVGDENGTGFLAFADAIKDFSIDDKQLKACTKAVSGLIDLSSEMESRGGLKGLIFGDKSFSDLGSDLAVFAEGLSAFYEQIAKVSQDGTYYAEEIKKIGVNIGERFADGIRSQQEDVKQAGKQLYASLANGISDQSATVASLGATIANDVYVGFSNKLHLNTAASQFYKMGQDTIDDFIDGANSKKSALQKAFTNLADSAINTANKALGINSPSKEFYKIGRYVVEGLANGVTDNYSISNSAMFKMGESLVNAIQTKLGIHSPSKVMRDEVGRYIVQGIAEGITNDMSAEEAAEKKAQNIISAFQTALDKYSLDLNTASLENELWTKLNPNATAMQSYEKQTDLVTQQLKLQAEKVKLAQAEYQAMLKAGADEEKVQESYNKYLQEQIQMAEYANTLAELRSTTAKDQQVAANEYFEYIKKYRESLENIGLTAEEIKEMAAQYSGYDPASIGEFGNTLTDIQKIIEEFLGSDQIEVVIAKSTASSVNSGVSKGISNASKTVKSGGSSITGDIAAGINQNDSAIPNATKNVLQKGLGAFKQTATEQGKEGGTSTIEGYIDSISDGIGKAGSVMRNFAGNAYQSFCDSLGINSPSKLMYEAGVYVVEGFANGINENNSLVVDAISNILSKAMANASADSPEFLLAVVSGFGDDTANAAPELIAALENVVDVLLDQSKLFESTGESLGDMFVKGIVAAMENGSNAIARAITQIVDTVVTDKLASLASQIASLRAQASAASRQLSTASYTTGAISSIGSPVITPVFDTSDLERKLSNMEVGLTTDKVSAASASFSAKSAPANQNGGGSGETATSGTNVTFNQYNTSPQALSATEIYRQTKNGLAQLKGVSQ